jgi:hypothetical protein
VQSLDCLFTDDFSEVQRLHPEADVQCLRELQSRFKLEIAKGEKDISTYLRSMQEYSILIQLSDPPPVRTEDLASTLAQLFQAHVRPMASPPRSQIQGGEPDGGSPTG